MSERGSGGRPKKKKGQKRAAADGRVGSLKQDTSLTQKKREGEKA